MMIRFSWSQLTAKEKIKKLEDDERPKARRALKYLLENDDETYKKFYEDQKGFPTWACR